MTILSVVVLRSMASSHRIACGFALWTCMYTVPSLRTSATAAVGPIGACFSNGISYVAESFVAAPAYAVSVCPLFTPNVLGVVVQSALRSASNRLPSPGNPAQSVHFVVPARIDAAWIALYSTGSTTATRLPLTTTCAFGNCFLSSLPTEMSFEPSVFGCTTRAWSIPGTLTSPTYVAWPETIGGIVRIGTDLPTTWY